MLLNVSIRIRKIHYAQKRTGDESPYYEPTYYPRNLRNP